MLHAFDGKSKYAETAFALGFKLSVPACIVRSPGLQKLVKRLPLDALLLETDSPALSPERGSVNRLTNIRIAAEEISRLQSKEVIEATNLNSRKLWLNEN